MRSTQQFSITLPNEMAEAVRAKVAAGEYATESEVIRDGCVFRPCRYPNPAEAGT
jgi:Arc/MetJ-type ribon-helix-helix transcriptional regulator